MRKHSRTYYDRVLRIISCALWAVIIAAIVLTLTGCKTPCPCATSGTNTQHSDTNDSAHTEYVHDSIYIDRYHTQFIKGDTVFIRDSVFRDRWHKQQIHDSIYIVSVDTITNTITVEVEKKGSAFLCGSGIALWVLIGCIVLGVIIGIIIKITKR